MYYSEVREFVTDKAAAACDAVQLEALMVAALLEMWGRPGVQSETTQTITTVADQADYTLTGFEVIYRVVDSDGCTLPAHVPSCSFFPCDCGTDDEDEFYSSYKLTGTTTLTLKPTPTEADKTYSVEGLAALDTTLWDMDGSVKVWRVVALPTGLHMAYAQEVLARVMADVDPGRAQMWLGMANADFDSWRNRMTGSSPKDYAVMSRQAVKHWHQSRFRTEENPYQRWTG